jgi:thiamine pyrophosphate-dependent acetolactate synthase large subunit-like protein
MKKNKENRPILRSAPGVNGSIEKGRDVPIASLDTEMRWGSDVVAEMLRRIGIEYIALNPGASYRGLHDSLVNYLGNQRPQMLTCLHEEHAVALAHGYAKVTGRPMAAAVHSNVGLMHATMAIYNAWCDRAPVIVIGATGPVDSMLRRPWIEWLHTSKDQGALVRPYVKWDDQPASVGSCVESIIRAHNIARAAPCGPVYICLDVSIQEDGIPEGMRIPSLDRFSMPESPAPRKEDMNALLEWVVKAENLVILLGRVNRDEKAWGERIQLFEKLGARVITDLKTAASFPSNHKLHTGAAGFRLSTHDKALIKSADLIVSLDWIDLAGALRQGYRSDPVSAKIVNVTLDGFRINGWSMDHQQLPLSDLTIASTPEQVVSDLSSLLPKGFKRSVKGRDKTHRRESLTLAAYRKQLSSNGPLPQVFKDTHSTASSEIDLTTLALAINDFFRTTPLSLLRLPLGWPGACCDFNHPLDYLGFDGGAGIGSGPGMVVGAALALRGSERLPVAVLGDGDLLMGAMALWSAARHKIPLLVIVADNRSFFNDEAHQEAVAKQRNRAPENKWIGQRLDDPAVNIADLAQSQGWQSVGGVHTVKALQAALKTGSKVVKEGGCFLIDVLTRPGYVSKMGSDEY